MIFSSIRHAVEDVFRPGALKVLGLGVGLSVGLLVLVTVLFTWVVGAITPDHFTLPFTHYQIGFVNDVASLATIGLMLVLSIFLMIPVASAFTGLFLEDVAALVEEAHYPDLPQIRKFTLAETIADSLRFLGVVIVANLVAFTVYFFILPFAPLLFFGLNGYLLGREYFQMAAARRLRKEQVQALYLKHRWTVWMTGALMAVVLTIPVVNLVVPVLGAATFTHLYHRLTGQVPRPRVLSSL
ncbi:MULTISPECIES: EI24 domain-containing protein [Thioclava]|uniref:EI24 domain-containing protein n=1 Tax=Thioclava litoralis TaxID=3076557 RepID=A0ABZ1E6K7_9RHOB|nr:EI24 domain-containing protein [Thioclava sp. FTW29]